MLNVRSIVKNLAPLLGVLVVLSPYGYSQNSDFTFESFSVDQGMPTIVQCILQDRTGYVWFATWSGLYRYDGCSFVSYRHDLDDTTSVKDNTLSTLFEDKTGVLWIGSWLGLEKFDRMTGTFIHYSPNPSHAGNDASNNVWAIREDKNGALWVGTGDGLYRFDRTTAKFNSLRYDSTDPGSISHNSVQAIHEGKDGSLWFGTGGGLDRLDFETGKFMHYWNDPAHRNTVWENSSGYWIQSIFEDESGIIWLGTNGGLVEFSPEAGTFLRHSPYSDPRVVHITSICRDATSGSLWMTTWDGLFSFDTKSRRFTHYKYDGVNYVYSERSGTLLIGTNTDIKKLNRTKQPFKNYSSKDIICAIGNGTEGILWMYTFHGWLKFDTKKEQFVPFSFGKAWLYFVYPQGELAFLTQEGSIYVCDSLGNRSVFLGPSWQEFNRSLSWGWKTREGYWLGTHQGRFCFLEPKTNRLKEVRNLKLDINYIYEDSFGSLWISTFMGKVFCYDPAKDTLVEFISDTKDLSSISGRVTNQIYEDGKGRLWFATSTGLNRLERSTNSFLHFTMKNGLPSNNIRGILEDGHGYLWLNTSKGISKFDPERSHFTNYDVSYGVELAADVYYGFGCKTRNGEMYFGGAKGFTRFHPDSVKDNPFIPPVVITSFRKFDKPYPFSHEMRLPYNENFISFEFVALSYISPERNQYAYKMEGLDEDWVYSGTRRFASYPGLEPGKYVFRVKGSNNDGVWNEEGTSISIVIFPPWWKASWAYFLYFLVIAGALYAGYRLRLSEVRLKHQAEMDHFQAEHLAEVDRLKSRFFANISHEFRTPLTLILGPI